MKCPDCYGGKLDVIRVRYRKDEEPKTPQEAAERFDNASRCPRCDGTGEAPDRMAEWIEQGHQMRVLRETAGVGLREAATMLGVSASTLSYYESGMVENSGLDICY